MQNNETAGAIANYSEIAEALRKEIRAGACSKEGSFPSLTKIMRRAQEGFAAFSTAKALEGLRVSRDGRVAGIVRVMEPHDVAPGETFGLSVPRYWRTDYFHAELATPEAAAAGVIELSKDGKEWKKLGTLTKAGTGQMHSRLKVEDDWRLARYRNVSDKPVSLKIDLFKFDVQGADSPVDFLLEEISR